MNSGGTSDGWNPTPERAPGPGRIAPAGPGPVSTASVAFTAPHGEAARVGLDLLRDGASAIDAMVGAAAAIAVAYHHMNGLGGDGFWLIARPGHAPVAIDAAGTAGAKATPAWYRERGFSAIPARGPGAALTVAGTVDGWRLAREFAGAAAWPLEAVLAPAIDLARTNLPATASEHAALRKVHPELAGNAEFAAMHYPDGAVPDAGTPRRKTALADLLEALARRGLDDFYRGEIATAIGAGLDARGAPLSRDDLAGFRAREVAPLTLKIRGARLFNLPAPTQGIASLLILGIYDRLLGAQPPQTGDDLDVDDVHLMVEATKRAFAVRAAEVTDPARLSPRWPGLTDPDFVGALAAQIDRERALPWPQPAAPGDTVWMGAMDATGTMVSFIQSVYWEFGSGVTLPEFGLVWNNRGTSFDLDGSATLGLGPGRKPFHTLNPAYAELDDGRRLVYGTMGGEGQPQTQAAVFTRYFRFGQPLSEAIAADRWLLGRTWGQADDDLKLEAGLYDGMADELTARGHVLARVPSGTEQMGHAGGIALGPDGSVDLGTDPRSDGAALVERVSTAG